jgi:hypothetical protein
LGIQGNEEADQLAALGAQKTLFDVIDTEIPKDFDVQGAKLSHMTQALAYQGIRERTKVEYKRHTLMNLDQMRYALENITKTLETDQAIWQSCTSKDLQKKIQIFLYKSIHNTHRIGNYWTNIPHYEQRSKCPTCHDEIESMEHILTTCDNQTRTTIWSLAQQLWPESLGPWPQITIGLIMGCGAISIRNNNNENENDEQQQRNSQKLRGASRLLRILISESRLQTIGGV